MPKDTHRAKLEYNIDKLVCCPNAMFLRLASTCLSVGLPDVLSRATLLSHQTFSSETLKVGLNSSLTIPVSRHSLRSIG